MQHEKKSTQTALHPETHARPKLDKLIVIVKHSDYKNTIHQKKHQHLNNNLHGIEDSINNNTFRGKWNNLYKQQKQEIPIKRWRNMGKLFQKRI